MQSILDEEAAQAVVAIRGAEVEVVDSVEAVVAEDLVEAAKVAEEAGDGGEIFTLVIIPRTNFATFCRRQEKGDRR